MVFRLFLSIVNNCKISRKSIITATIPFQNDFCLSFTQQFVPLSIEIQFFIFEGQAKRKNNKGL